MEHSTKLKLAFACVVLGYVIGWIIGTFMDELDMVRVHLTVHDNVLTKMTGDMYGKRKPVEPCEGCE